MSAMRQWVPVFVMLSSACGSVEVPLPSLASVEPASVPADSRFLLTLELDGQLPFMVDYDKDAASLIAPEQVTIGDRMFDVSETDDTGHRITLDIIPWLPIGEQDVQVQFKDGRQAVLEKGIAVQPPLDLASFEIDPIGPQVRGQPFTVTIRAKGSDAARFQGRVIVRSTQGDVNPKVTDEFVNGVVQQEFTAEDSTESTIVIIVEDYAGHTGRSNEFLLSRP